MRGVIWSTCEARKFWLVSYKRMRFRTINPPPGPSHKERSRKIPYESQRNYEKYQPRQPCKLQKPVNELHQPYECQ